MNFDAEEATGGNTWYLVHTRPKQENVALLNLQQQGFQAYLPLYKNLKNTLAGGLIGFEPMFARYVFFRPASATQSISTARSTRGGWPALCVLGMSLPSSKRAHCVV